MERIDPFEKKILELTGASPSYERLAARIIEEGMEPGDVLLLVRPPARRAATAAAAVLIRALRPPFKLKNSRLFGEAVFWEVP